MKYKIIADSGSNVTTLADTDFASVPITIMAGGKEYIDDAALDILAMTDELRKLSTKSSTACPNIDQWLTAFGKAFKMCINMHFRYMKQWLTTVCL